MENNKINKLNKLTPYIIIFILVLSTFSLNILSLSRGKINNKSIYTDGNGTYLMTTLDAYYYMRLSKEFLSGTYDDYDELSGRQFPKPLPLLSAILVFSNKLTGASMEKVAFYLPIFLSCLSFLIFLLWGRLLGGNILFLFAGLIFSTSFYWFMRTCIGRFDTDTFNIIFIFSLCYFVYMFVNKKESIQRVIYFLLYILVSILFLIWWIPAKYLIIPVFIIPYSLSYFLSKSNKFENNIKKFLMIFSLLMIFIVFTNLHLFFPPILKNLFIELKSHIALIQKNTSEIYADVGSSITELLPVNFHTISYDIAGHPLLIPIFLAGFFLLLRYQYRKLIFLIIPFILSLFMFSANRFVIFFLPFYAFSIAYFFYFILNSDYLKRLTLKYRYLLTGVLFFIVLIVNINKSLRFYPLPVVTPYDVIVAKSINEKSPKESLIWSMWDYGYFLQYYCNRKTFVDGGSQTPERVFMSSLPLSVNDLRLSANLIKFFSVHGEDGLNSILNLTKNYTKMKLFLIKALNNREKLGEVLGEFNIEYDKKLEEFLFPSGEVYIFLNGGYFDKAYWWFYFASYDSDKKSGIHPFTKRIELSQGQFDGNKGLLSLSSTIYPIRELFNYVARPTPGVTTTKLYNNEKGLSMVISPSENQAYLMDYSFARTTFVRLFFLNPMINNEYFRTISYAPLESGAWKVK